MLNEKEKQLIIALRNNSRQKINQVAKKCGYPVSTMFELLNRMEQSSMIRHSTKIDFQQVGFPIKMFVNARARHESREKLQDFLAKSRNLNSLHVVNSGYDYIAEMVFRNQKEAYDFLDQLDTSKLAQQHTEYHVIDTLQTEKFLTDESHFQ